MDTLQLVVRRGKYAFPSYSVEQMVSRSYRIAAANPGDIAPPVPAEWWDFVRSHIQECRLGDAVIGNAWFSGRSLCFAHFDNGYYEKPLDEVVVQLLSECTGVPVERIELTELPGVADD